MHFTFHLQQFLQQFSVALSPILIDRVGPQYQQSHNDKKHGHRRDQHLQC